MTDLTEFHEAEHVEKSAKAERRIEHLSREVKGLKTRLELETQQREDLTRTISVLQQADDMRLSPPRWLKPAKPKRHRSTLVAVLSDLHLDQVVDAAEMRGLNAYNRQIAVGRLREWAENVVNLGQHHINDVRWDGVVVPVLGDLYPGDIHLELVRSNEAHTLASVEFWADHLVAALRLVADAYGKVHVPWVVGNHGRTTVKPVFSGRATSNVDWLTGRIVARELKGDKRFTFDVPVSMETSFTAYSTTFQCYHGETNGGGGIGGIWPPIMRLDAKKRQRQSAVGDPYDHLLIGHWHQLVFAKGFTVNGSMVGYDEYAYGNSLGYEPPQQAFLVVHPEHGITIRGPIHCQPKGEVW